MTSPAGGEAVVPRAPLALRVAGAAIYGVAGFMTGILELLFVPFRLGSVIIPIAVVLTILSNALLPWLGRQITGDLAGSLAPFVGWLVAVAVFALHAAPEGDVILPGGSGADAVVGYALLVAGFTTGLTAVLRTSSLALTAERAARRPRADIRR